MSFAPLQIIMRTLFRLIICTFCYDISFKCWIFHNPMVFSPRFFLLLQGSYVCRIIRFLSYWFLYLFIADVLCFVLRSYVCKILGLYHVLMYVCWLHRFVVPRFFCLYRLPMYVDPHVFFHIEVLCMQDLRLEPCPYVWDVCRLLISIAYNFYACTEFPCMWNSMFFACTEFLRKKVKHFIPIRNKNVLLQLLLSSMEFLHM